MVSNKLKFYSHILNFLILLLNSTDILNYICFLCIFEGIIVVGQSLYSHILSYFFLSVFICIVIFWLGATFILIYFIASHSLLKFYLKSFKLYTSNFNSSYFFIEITTDLLFKIFSFFLVVCLFFWLVVNVFNQSKFGWLHLVLAFLFFFIPTFQYDIYIIVSFFTFEIYLLFLKMIIHLNWRGIEPLTSPLSGVRSTNWAISSKQEG